MTDLVGTLRNHQGEVKTSGSQHPDGFHQYRSGILEVFQKTDAEYAVVTVRWKIGLPCVSLHQSWQFESFLGEIRLGDFKPGAGEIQHGHVATVAGEIHGSGAATGAEF